MSLLSGTLTARRYHVVGEAPGGDFRPRFAKSLRENAFQPATSRLIEPRFGWVSHRNMLEADFTDEAADWWFEPWALFSLRIDTPVIPQRLLKAHLQKRVREWCTEHRRQRCPRAVKQDLREQVLESLVHRALPRTAVIEVGWNVPDGWLFFAGLGKKAAQTFELIFGGTFDLPLRAYDPLLLLEESAAATLASLRASDYGLSAWSPPTEAEPEAADEDEDDEEIAAVPLRLVEAVSP
jgi:DNA recombination-dependent growth factor C